jgi:hypothetical protein
MRMAEQMAPEEARPNRPSSLETGGLGEVGGGARPQAKHPNRAPPYSQTSEVEAVRWVRCRARAARADVLDATTIGGAACA